MMNQELDEELKDDVFSFLDGLRESGIVNMFGATPFIMDEFYIDGQEEAEAYLLEWMRTFSERHSE